MSARKLIYDLSLSDLEARLQEMGQPGYRARQMFHALYKELSPGPEEMTTLPKGLRSAVAGAFEFSGLRPRLTVASRDGHTHKSLFELQDGQLVETVLMRYRRRNTLCISTQAGCAMGCVFCATGQMGFRRNLTSGEIVAQVVHFARVLKLENASVTNVVLMGMGEPLHNYDATMQALRLLNDPQGLGLGARRFTVSTVGLVPAIRRFTNEGMQANLAVSLHAAEDDLRSSMLPVNDRYPLDALMSACRAYVQRTSRRITFEWALVQDVNDSEDQARALSRLVKGLNCHVNVIPLNPTDAYSGRATTRERAKNFQTVLEAAGIPCTIRVRRGIDIQAGCGQLATRGNDE